MALIGYPSFSKWSAENWAAGLMTGPPLSYLKSKDVGLPVFMIETDDRSVNIEDFSLLRDFQIIRPRLFGTLEYRGNGSCGGVEKIMAATAIRLASVLLALDSKKDSVITYQQGREHWLKLLETTNPVYPEELEARVRRVLELRGLNEEKYLP
jgi:hypothetical protein